MQLFFLTSITVKEIWGNTCETNLYSLFIKQKKAIRIVCHAKYLDHTSRLFHKLKLLKSSDVVHFDTCIFMYKAFHNLLPPSMQSYFSRSFSKKYYFNFHVHFARTQRKKFSISRIGVSFWNALDAKIKSSSSLSSFKIALKNSIINTYINNQWFINTLFMMYTCKCITAILYNIACCD